MEHLLQAIRISYTIPELEKRLRQAAHLVKTREQEQALPELKAFNEAKSLVSVVSNPEAYDHLSVEQGHEIALAAIERYDALPQRDDFLPQEVLTNLADAVPGALKGLTHLLLERRLAFAQNQMFREADAATRDQIIALLEAGTSAYYSREDLLSALAWIGDEGVQACFQNWRDHPPAWRTELIHPPEHYATYGGWELTRQGSRKDLYYPINYDLVPAETVSAEAQMGPVEVVTAHEGGCGWCERPLLTLFEIDLQDSRMAFSGLEGKKLRIAMCMNCSLQGEHIFTDVDGNGASCWSSLNGDRPSHLRCFDEEDIGVDSLPRRQLVAGAARRTPYLSHGSHLGGCPLWVQNPDYPLCPSCQQAMTFVGQYEPYQVDYIEGIIYAFSARSAGRLQPAINKHKKDIHLS